MRMHDHELYQTGLQGGGSNRAGTCAQQRLVEGLALHELLGGEEQSVEDGRTKCLVKEDFG